MKYSWRFLRSLAGLALSLPCLVSIASPQQTATADPSSVQLVAKQAVDLILSRYQIDTNNVVSKTGKPLPADGKWAIGKETPESCPKSTSPCLRVLYRVPDAGVSCEWTVLLQGTDDTDIVLDFNDDAARYLTRKPHSGMLGVKKLSGNNPTYPPQARDSRIQGTVKMMVHIDAAGHVDKIAVISGPEELREAAVTAVKSWVYQPLIVESNAVPVQTLINVNFAIGR